MARVPGVLREGLDGGYGYTDAVTDDARLVLRTIREATLHGATAVNYVRAESLVREGGRVTGAELVDQEDRRRVTVRARVVFNTTGAESDQLRQGAGGARRLHRIRGTHLVFPLDALPISQAISFRHPKNARYIYMLPWEGAALVGTTEVDERGEVGREPHATEAEVTYLLEALSTWLPGLRLRRDDILATFAGVRPVMDTGAADPYREPRDSVLWKEDGLVIVISGKLTGFQPIVQRALDSALGPVPGGEGRPALDRSFAPGDVEALSHLKDGVNTRLLGRYGADASYLVAAARPGELEPVGDTPALWGELRWGARAEGVVHLDDLLLRRTRVGLVLRHGGLDHFSRVRDLCREELGWDTQRWSEEEERYCRLWQEAYRVPGEV